jgi:hypothetical protein
LLRNSAFSESVSEIDQPFYVPTYLLKESFSGDRPTLEVPATFCLVRAEVGTHPRWAANIVDQFRTGFVYLGNDLECGGSVADDGYPLAFEVVFRIPTGRVK